MFSVIKNLKNSLLTKLGGNETNKFYKYDIKK